MYIHTLNKSSPIGQTTVDSFKKTERFTLDCDETTGDNTETNKVLCGYSGCPMSHLLDGLCHRNHKQTCQYNDLNMFQPHEPVANKPKTKTKEKSPDSKTDFMLCDSGWFDGLV